MSELSDEYSANQNSEAKLSEVPPDSAVDTFGSAGLVAGSAGLVAGSAGRNEPAADSIALELKHAGSKLQKCINLTAEKTQTALSDQQFQHAS